MIVGIKIISQPALVTKLRPISCFPVMAGHTIVLAQLALHTTSSHQAIPLPFDLYLKI